MGNGESESGPARHQLQCWNQIVREWRAVAGGAIAAEGNGESESGPERHQLQRRNQRLREGQAVAGGAVAAEGDGKRSWTQTSSAIVLESLPARRAGGGRRRSRC